jgi:hypothetical protein
MQESRKLFGGEDSSRETRVRIVLLSDNPSFFLNSFRLRNFFYIDIV